MVHIQNDPYHIWLFPSFSAEHRILKEFCIFQCKFSNGPFENLFKDSSFCQIFDFSRIPNLKLFTFPCHGSGTPSIYDEFTDWRRWGRKGGEERSEGLKLTIDDWYYYVFCHLIYSTTFTSPQYCSNIFVMYTNRTFKIQK